MYFSLQKIKRINTLLSASARLSRFPHLQLKPCMNFAGVTLNAPRRFLATLQRRFEAIHISDCPLNALNEFLDVRAASPLPFFPLRIHASWLRVQWNISRGEWSRLLDNLSCLPRCTPPSAKINRPWINTLTTCSARRSRCTTSNDLHRRLQQIFVDSRREGLTEAELHAARDGLITYLPRDFTWSPGYHG